jgi:hypothetical protein
VTPGVPVTVTLRVTVAAGVREGRVINNRVVLDDGTGGRLAVASGLTPVRWYRVWLPLVKGRGASFAVGDDAPR